MSQDSLDPTDGCSSRHAEALIAIRDICSCDSPLAKWLKSTFLAFKEGKDSSRCVTSTRAPHMYQRAIDYRFFRFTLSQRIDELHAILCAIDTARGAKTNAGVKTLRAVRPLPLSASPDALCILYVRKVWPLRRLWEGFTLLPALDLLLVIELIDNAARKVKYRATHDAVMGIPPNPEDLRILHLLTGMRDDLKKRVAGSLTIGRLLLISLCAIAALAMAGLLHFLTFGRIVAFLIACLTWAAIEDSPRLALKRKSIDATLMKRIRRLELSVFGLLHFDDLVIADFEYFQAFEQLAELEMQLSDAVLAAIKARRHLKDKLRKEREKARARAGSLRRSN